jgi:hypothetical protein
MKDQMTIKIFRVLQRNVEIQMAILNNERIELRKKYNFSLKI